MLRNLIHTIIITVVLAPPAFSEEVRIIGGDSLEIGDEMIRINGIDAPERWFCDEGKALHTGSRPPKW
jgi:endonuclease YncB( thermonuclease family)